MNYLHIVDYSKYTNDFSPYLLQFISICFETTKHDVEANTHHLDRYNNFLQKKALCILRY